MSVDSLLTGIIGFVIIFLIIVFIGAIFEIVGMWSVFKKAGKKGWEAIIPYYNIWTLVEVSECKWWFFLLAIASSLFSFGISFNINETSTINYNPLDFIGSLANLFAMFMINYNIAKKFNKNYGYAIGLTLLPFVFYPILGFGSSKYDKNIKVSPYGVIEEGVK